MTLKVVNPLEIPNWDSLVLSLPGYSVFHSSGWAGVLLDTYGFLPYYLCGFEGEALSSCLPIMEVTSFLTGRKGVSLPFTDFCAPLLNGTVSSRELTDFAVALGCDRHWKYLEFRGGEYSNIPRLHDHSTNSTTSPRLPHSSPEPSDRDKRKELDKPDERNQPYLSFSHHELDLSPGVEKLFQALRGSTRRNIKKAVSEGVRVRIGSDVNSIKNYYRLHSLTRKRHGMPPQPFHFFKMLHQHQIGNGQGFVALAEYQGRPIAGAVFLTFGDQAIFKFGASDIRYSGVRPNNLVMWEGIRRLGETGFRYLSLGRTELENKGLIQFKSGWGAEEKVSTYTRFDFKTGSYVHNVRNFHTLYSKVFQKTPLPLLKVLGNLFYKHFGV